MKEYKACESPDYISYVSFFTANALITEVTQIGLTGERPSTVVRLCCASGVLDLH